MKSTIKQSTGKKFSAYVQKLFTLVFAFGVFMTVHGQVNDYNPTIVAHKEINDTRSLENVEISGDVIVYLTNEKSSDIVLQGDSKDIAAVITTENDNKLEINAAKAKAASKLVVYIPSARMHSLKITGDARIFSSGDIVVDDLEITLKGNSMVKVYHYGKLTVKPAQGYELGDVARTY
jgi:putative autotransporter adhesin-like protein